MEGGGGEIEIISGGGGEAMKDGAAVTQTKKMTKKTKKAKRMAKTLTMSQRFDETERK